MGPFRDELAAAHARIAELEATIEQIRASSRPRSQLHRRRQPWLVASAVVGVGMAVLSSPATAHRSLIQPRGWAVPHAALHAPFEFDEPYSARNVHIDCFSGEYKCQ